MNLSGLYLAAAQVEASGVKEQGSLLDLVFRSNVLNLLIVIVILFWLVRKFKVFSVIAERQLDIKKKIKESEEQKIQAELKLEATQKKFKKSDEEVQKISKDTQQIAANLSKRIIKDADIEAGELAKKADRIIKADKELAINDVTNEISKAAFIIAEEHVKKSIDDRLHQKYINEFIENLTNIKV